MLGLIKIAGLSAALSAGVVVALPPTEPDTRSGKAYTERLGDAGRPGHLMRTVSTLAGPGVAVESKASRLFAVAAGPSGTITVERREPGMSVLVRGAPPPPTDRP